MNKDLHPDRPAECNNLPGQVVLVFQGGGALGSYQAGVYQALHEADIEPDWIIGTSIGAINASLIAGNRRDDRIPKLREFWRRVESHPGWNFSGFSTGFSDALSNWSILVGGIPGFFKPNVLAHWRMDLPMGSDYAGYYSTMPLQKTLLESVRRDYAGLHSFLSMSLIEARRRKASALRLRFSQSLARRLQRPSHANVRSTTHRFGRTTNAFA